MCVGTEVCDTISHAAAVCTEQLLSITLLKNSWASNSCVSILPGLELLRGLWHTAQCVAACCSLLQSCAVRCTVVSMLQCVAVCCSVWVLRVTFVCMGWQQLVRSLTCKVSLAQNLFYIDQQVSSHTCSRMIHTNLQSCIRHQHIVTHCNTLQHTATHCNTLNRFYKDGAINKPQPKPTSLFVREDRKTDRRISWKQLFMRHKVFLNELLLTATHCNTLQHTATHNGLHSNTVIYTVVSEILWWPTHCHVTNTAVT